MIHFMLLFFILIIRYIKVFNFILPSFLLFFTSFSLIFCFNNLCYIEEYNIGIIDIVSLILSFIISIPYYSLLSFLLLNIGSAILISIKCFYQFL